MQAISRPLDAGATSQATNYSSSLIKHDFIKPLKNGEGFLDANGPITRSQTSNQNNNDPPRGQNTIDARSNTVQNIISIENSPPPTTHASDDDFYIGTVASTSSTVTMGSPIARPDRLISTQSQGSDAVASPAVTTKEIINAFKPFQGKSLSADELKKLMYKDRKCSHNLISGALKEHIVSTHPKIVQKFNLSL